MLHRRTTFILLCAGIVTVLAVLLSRSRDSALSRGDHKAHDLLARHGRGTPPNPKLIFLAIDSDSVGLDAKADLENLFGITDEKTPEARALTAMSEHWPWPRSVYAQILDRLIAAGAKVVVFDLMFTKPTEDDGVFREALERYAGRVVIGSNFTTSLAEESGRMDASLASPSNALIPPTDTPDSRVGFVNFWPDSDGIIRQARFQANFAQFLGAAGNLGEKDHPSLAAQAVRKFGRPQLVPTDNSSHTFRYTAARQQGFRPRSIFEIFVPEYWTRNFGAGAAFDGAIVVVGAAGNWQHDEHQTPFGLTSGPEIQLNVINALLHREFLRPFSAPAWLVTYLVTGALAACLNIFCSQPLLRLGLLSVVSFAWLGIQLPLFNQLGLLAPIAGPLAIVSATGVAVLIYDLVRTAAEQLRLHLTLQERKRTQEMLERVNAELEQRVTERTAELTQANTLLTGSLAEKDVLLKEVHHRVKNNLQVISSLLSLQSGYIKDPVALQVFTESRNRVRSMALIHEKLYQSQDLSRIDFEDYIKAVSSGLLATFAGRSSSIRISVDVDRVMLPVDSAVPCGLIVNELVTNCFKYAFAGTDTGEICVSMKRIDAAQLRLSVSDNGVGFPKDLDFRNTESLGMQLVTTLADQLDGTVALKNGCGTTFEISFPEANPIKV
jgi:two-component sensor histidine kinase/CHASE2 domain-containing sensor protein